MHFMGTSDPLPASEVAELVGFLKQRLHHWSPSISSSKRYDDAVKRLILATLKEYDKLFQSKFSESFKQEILKAINEYEHR